MKTEINILDVKKRFDLLKRIYGRTYCDALKLAKALGVKRTDLMDFIEQNPKLFNVGNGNKGLIIRDVFLKPEENYRTEEWLKKKIEDNRMYIHIDEIGNYGRIVGYGIVCDEPGNTHKDLWRNTKEKIDQIQKLGVIKFKEYNLRYLGNSYEYKSDYDISEEGIKVLEEHGWSHNELHPINHMTNIRYRLPSYWDGALINGDNTGLTDDEIQEITSFLETAEGYPVDVDWETEGYYSCNDANDIPADCVDFIFVIL